VAAVNAAKVLATRMSASILLDWFSRRGKTCCRRGSRREAIRWHTPLYLLRHAMTANVQWWQPWRAISCVSLFAGTDGCPHGEGRGSSVHCLISSERDWKIVRHSRNGWRL